MVLFFFRIYDFLTTEESVQSVDLSPNRVIFYSAVIRPYMMTANQSDDAAVFQEDCCKSQGEKILKKIW